MSKKIESVKVSVRCRPMSRTEKEDNRECIVRVDTRKSELVIKNPKTDSNEPPKTFTYDFTYGSESSQEQIYCDTAYPIVESVLEGYNGTIFAYGQTGTGKTFTMEGIEEPQEQRGILPRAFEQIFYGVEQHPDTQFLICASFLEIYNEEIHDLLSKNSKNKLDIKENAEGVFYVKDLTSMVVKSIHEMKEVMEAGRKNRHVGETLMNRDSSRSHSIFAIKIETSESDKVGTNHYKAAKLNLVDLAGSERQSKTGATGDRLKEATNINKSLLTLGNVISALVDGVSSHVPYRDSKLTKLLQDSLGGNTRTVMIANIGPADWNYDETISTLRYANRAKNIQNKPKINEDPKDALLREFQDEISRLRAQLEMQGGDLTYDQATMGGQILGISQPKIIEVEKVIKIENKEKIAEMEKKLLEEKEEIKKMTEDKKKEIETQKNLAEDQKLKLLDELQKTTEEQELEKEKQAKLIKKLKQMQEKLVQGSQMMENAVRQEQELQKARMELEMRTRQEQQLAKELEKRAEENFNLEQRFSSQQEEIEDKNRKLKKLFVKKQAIDSEIQDLNHEFQLEREDLVQEIRSLTQQIKLKNIILTSFIPQEEIMHIERIARWDEESEEWSLPRLDISGNHVKGPKGENYKKKGNNKKDIEEYDGMVSQKVQSTVQSILQEYNEEVMPIDTNPGVYFIYGEDGPMREENESRAQKPKRTKTGKRPGTASKKAKRPATAQKEVVKKETQDLYPKAKGLVPKRG
jgi:Kinesin motor domain